MTKGILPLAAMEKLLKKSNSSIRVSDDAKESLKDHLEGVGEQIAEKAARLAEHSGRKTIKAADIKLAIK